MLQLLTICYKLYGVVRNSKQFSAKPARNPKSLELVRTCYNFLQLTNKHWKRLIAEDSLQVVTSTNNFLQLLTSYMFSIAKHVIQAINPIISSVSIQLLTSCNKFLQLRTTSYKLYYFSVQHADRRSDAKSRTTCYNFLQILTTSNNFLQLHICLSSIVYSTVGPLLYFLQLVTTHR